MEMITKQNQRLKNINILKLVTIVLTFVVMTLITHRSAAAQNAEVYKEGIYCYQITDEEKKEVSLVGIEPSEVIKELVIPGTATINDKQYTVSGVSISYDYYSKEELQKLYQHITKVNVANNFTGAIYHLHSAFKNLRTYEFYGTKAPKEVKEVISNQSENLDILFLVPKGTEADYAKVINFTMNYSLASDLYEFDIPMAPTVVSETNGNIEYGCFQVNGLIYQVTSSAKTGKGTVQLIGQNKVHDYSYLKLPSEIENNGYTYSLTKLNRNSLIASGAKVVVIPNTVAKMDSFVFDKKVELLFLSKNCNMIPNLITDENNDSNLRFAYVPEGVTTITDHSYPNIMKYEASVILPTSIKTLGKKSLYDYKLVTFLNKKPIKNIATAIKAGTTVKVNKSAIKAYQAALGNKVKVIAAKDVVKATKLIVNATSLTLDTSQTKQLKGTLTKGSNETVFWLSSDQNILEVSDQGVINPKKAGTAYVIAYTRTSGLHQAVKVTVTDKLITKGIYTYRVTDAGKQTVSLCQVKPEKTTEKLSIPEKISYNGKTYTVTGILANPDNANLPLIPDDYGNNRIKEIIIPKSITGVVGYLGKLEQIKSITFQGTKVPEEIHWYGDYGKLAFQSVIYVPKNCVDTYLSALRLCIADDIYSYKTYGCSMDFNVVESGSNQLRRFVKDGILYRVTVMAGKGHGKVAVKGADLNMEKINVGNTVTYGKYTYDVTEVYKDAFADRPASNIKLGSSIKKVGSTEKYNLPMYLFIGMPGQVEQPKP